MTLTFELIKPTKTRLQRDLFHLNPDIQQESCLFTYFKLQCGSRSTGLEHYFRKRVHLRHQEKMREPKFQSKPESFSEWAFNLIFTETASVVYRVEKLGQACFSMLNDVIDNISF